MRSPATPPAVDKLADRLATTPGVIAVALGGSRATETARHDSDWDLAVYYRTSRRRLDPDDVRALGYTGEVSELGAWGPIVNGGAWLTVADHPVDLLFRDLDLAEHWLREAHAGRFEVLDQHGYLVGAPTYILAGELALGQPLRGQLPHPEFSDALATSASLLARARTRVIDVRDHLRRHRRARRLPGHARERNPVRRALPANRPSRVGAERETPGPTCRSKTHRHALARR